ncbi:MAG TPA: isochorismate synthase [Rubrobacteraceae bacterium]|nr:isochorismate synthase [Rubrobacteraceae bacterium]
MLSRNIRGPVFERTDARWMLADAVSRALALNDALLEDEAILRVEVPAGDLDPLRWLGSQTMRPRFYWSGREDATDVAAIGVADVVEGETPADGAKLHERLALLSSGVSDARYYGGLRFDPACEAEEEWEAFGAYRFVLPRFELRRRDGATMLACNLVLPRDSERSGELLDAIESLTLEEPLYVGNSLTAPVSRCDNPNREGWRENIASALEAFAAGSMDKVVLARRAEFEFENDLDAVKMVMGLRAATPGCFHFLVEPEEGATFVGASPERLFRREARRIVSEAVAGTRPRGVSEADDEELREELLGSVKDQAEHSYVRISIGETLGPLCEELEIEDRASEMKLARGRHLVSKVRGTLRESVTDTEILAALHPTPAVGGYPKGVALEEIRNLEPFDRGWYAGPIGWIGADASEFAVGIRSGLARGNTLALYSGAGIVAGSTPDGEWAEIEQKIGDFTRVFGLDPEEHAAT